MLFPLTQMMTIDYLSLNRWSAPVAPLLNWLLKTAIETNLHQCRCSVLTVSVWLMCLSPVCLSPLVSFCLLLSHGPTLGPTVCQESRAEESQITTCWHSLQRPLLVAALRHSLRLNCRSEAGVSHFEQSSPVIITTFVNY